MQRYLRGSGSLVLLTSVLGIILSTPSATSCCLVSVPNPDILLVWTGLKRCSKIVVCVQIMKEILLEEQVGKY